MSENNLPNMDGNNEELDNQALNNEDTENQAVENEAAASDFAGADEGFAEEDYSYNDNTADYAEAPVSDGVAAESPKNHTAAIAIGAVAALVLIIAGLLIWYITKPLPQPTYIDVNGQTLGDMAASTGMELSEIIYMYDLPKNTPAEASISQVQYMIPLKKMAVMNQMGLQKFKEQYNIPDEITGEGNFLDTILKVFGINRYKITGDTPFGLAEGEITLGDYIGEENLEEFKEEYGISADATVDTKWKEVRDTVMAKQKEEYEAQQAKMNAPAETEPEDNTESPAPEGDASAEPTEAPAAE